MRRQWKFSSPQAQIKLIAGLRRPEQQSRRGTRRAAAGRLFYVCALANVRSWPIATDIAPQPNVRCWMDCVAKLLLRRLANDDSVGLRRASAGAAHDGSAGRRTGAVLLFL